MRLPVAMAAIDGRLTPAVGSSGLVPPTGGEVGEELGEATGLEAGLAFGEGEAEAEA